MHICSTVSGKLKSEYNCFDALSSCLPVGTVSGAPKIRAMEIIDELETVRRGIYAGAVGNFSYNGNMDTCIALRTIVLKGDYGYVQAGAGLVYDSVPVTEYKETLSKSMALREVL
jgi:anthranilate synthase component 1